MAIGFPSAAYRASADLLIDQDDFLRSALGFDDEPDMKQAAQPADPPPPALSDTAFKLMRQAVAESATPVPLAKLASLVLSKVVGMDASSWAGFGSFRALLESQRLSPLVVSWDGGGTIHDPKRHTLEGVQPTKESESRTEIATGVADLIRAEVSKAKQPVHCGSLAALILDQHESLAADWGGKGTFRKFVEPLDLRPVVFDWNGSGGTARDPARHLWVEEGKPSARLDDWGDEPALYRAAKQIHEVTGIPLLSPAKYRNLFGTIEADVAAHSFHLMETGKRIRDFCRDAGKPVSRADVNHVLRGLLIRGHTFEQGCNDAGMLARKLADNVRSLCLREQIVFDDETNSAIDRWIVGGD